MLPVKIAVRAVVQPAAERDAGLPAPPAVAGVVVQPAAEPAVVLPVKIAVRAALGTFAAPLVPPALAAVAGFAALADALARPLGRAASQHYRCCVWVAAEPALWLRSGVSICRARSRLLKEQPQASPSLADSGCPLLSQPALMLEATVGLVPVRPAPGEACPEAAIPGLDRGRERQADRLRSAAPSWSSAPRSVQALGLLAEPRSAVNLLAAAATDPAVSPEPAVRLAAAAFCRLARPAAGSALWLRTGVSICRARSRLLKEQPQASPSLADSGCPLLSQPALMLEATVGLVPVRPAPGEACPEAAIPGLDRGRERQADRLRSAAPSWSSAPRSVQALGLLAEPRSAVNLLAAAATDPAVSPERAARLAAAASCRLARPAAGRVPLGSDCPGSAWDPGPASSLRPAAARP